MGETISSSEIPIESLPSRTKRVIKSKVYKALRLPIIDVLKFILNAGLVFIYTCLGLLAQDWISKGAVSLENFGLSALISIVLLLITYLRERIVTSSANKKIIDSKLIFECLDGAIIKLRDYLTERKGTTKYFSSLLCTVERLTFILLKDYGSQEYDITANLMVPKVINQGKEILELKYRGTCLRGRQGKRELVVNRTDPAPGAVVAFMNSVTAYIPDISKYPNDKYFGKDCPYRSVLSIPISLKSGVKYILNIDSLHPDAFISAEVINKVILPTIDPLLNLFLIEK